MNRWRATNVGLAVVSHAPAVVDSPPALHSLAPSNSPTKKTLQVQSVPGIRDLPRIGVHGNLIERLEASKQQHCDLCRDLSRASGKGDTLAQKSRGSPPPQSCITRIANENLEVTGSTRLLSLAVRSITVFMSTSSGNKLVGVLKRMLAY
eukprot:88040-Pelagomonas_calceolata.AAC.1